MPLPSLMPCIIFLSAIFPSLPRPARRFPRSHRRGAAYNMWNLCAVTCCASRAKQAALEEVRLLLVAAAAAAAAGDGDGDGDSWRPVNVVEERSSTSGPVFRQPSKCRSPTNDFPVQRNGHGAPNAHSSSKGATQKEKENANARKNSRHRITVGAGAGVGIGVGIIIGGCRLLRCRLLGLLAAVHRELWNA
ncbi:hypothetical protein LZ30DRAFT_767196 [Colletotrichum cereale]|nr:hypothetical protein LZ30DRAFT_767196 [Colletotrichum cereale]